MNPMPDGQDSPPLTGRRIMIAEDDAILALDLTTTFEEEGIAIVGPFHRLSTALGCDLAQIDGAVLDVDLNGVEVFPLADQLRERRIPTLFHTARTAFDRELYPDAAICAKPCLADRVVTRLSALVASGEPCAAEPAVAR